MPFNYSKLTLALLCCLVLTTNAWSQQSKIGNWLAYVGNQSFATKWVWHNEVQYRNYNALGDLQQLLLRTGIGYNLDNQNNILLAGYAFVHSENYQSDNITKNNIQEHRIFQQFITKQQFNRVYLLHRYRYEQRFVENNFSTRLRYLFAITVPLNAKTLEAKTIYAMCSNEVFIQNRNPLFDRNRLAGGLGYCINKALRFELGYMWQKLERNHRSQFQLTLLNNLPFTQKDS